MKTISIIPLRSSIGANENELNQERDDYLRALSTLLDISFTLNKKAKTPIFFIETGGSEEAFLKVYKTYSPPYYLLTTTRRNSLPAALEMGAFLASQNLPYKIIHGSLEQVASTLKEILDETKESRPSIFRLGAIGKPSDWLIASNLDRGYAKEKYHIELIDIDYVEFTAEIDKKSYESSEYLEKLREKAANSKYLEGALYIYGALKRLILKHDLHGFSIRCFDLLGIYKNTACLALALLNEEGISAGCEGDLPILIAMHLVKRLLNLDSFQANPSSVDLLQKTIIFAHCTTPFSMCQKPSFMTHFESGLGVGIRGEMKLGPCTIFRLSGNLRKALIIEGNIIENLSRDDLCRTQILIKVENGLEKIIENPLGNHHLIIYGHHKGDLVKCLRALDSSLELV